MREPGFDGPTITEFQGVEDAAGPEAMGAALTPAAPTPR